MKPLLSVFLLLSAACANSPSPVETASLKTQMVSIVPFGLETGRPTINVMINGKGPYSFVFDTGAPGLALMSHLADELNIDSTGVQMVGSPAGGEPVEAKTATIERLSAGGTEITKVDALILNFGGPGLGDGVIGPSMFKGTGRTAIDFKKQKVEFGGGFKSAADANWIAFGESAPILDVTLIIDDIEMPAHIDTGAPHVISVPEKFADKLPLAGPVQTVARARTIDREFEIKGAPIDMIATIGDAKIPLSQVQFFDLPFANIGSGALRNLYLEIDWRNERYTISGIADPVALQPRRVRGTPAETKEQ